MLSQILLLVYYSNCDNKVRHIKWITIIMMMLKFISKAEEDNDMYFYNSTQDEFWQVLEILFD